MFPHWIIVRDLPHPLQPAVSTNWTGSYRGNEPWPLASKNEPRPFCVFKNISSYIIDFHSYYNKDEGKHIQRLIQLIDLILPEQRCGGSVWVVPAWCEKRRVIGRWSPARPPCDWAPVAGETAVCLFFWNTADFMKWALWLMPRCLVLELAGVRCVIFTAYCGINHTEQLLYYDYNVQTVG